MDNLKDNTAVKRIILYVIQLSDRVYNVTCVSAELQRGPIRHNGAKKKLQLKHKHSLFTLQTFHYNNY
jgi:hypothetical protein